MDISKHVNVGGNDLSHLLCKMKQFPVKIDITGNHNIRIRHLLRFKSIGRFLNILQIAVNLPPPGLIVKHHGVWRFL
jgi:hypothetical protein